MRTWHIEMLVVACVLVAVAVVAGKGWVEWIGVLAVLLTFGYVQVADRLAEWAAHEEGLVRLDPLPLQPASVVERRGKTVECHRWAVRYLVSKEACWFAYFALLGARSAIVGVLVFLAYPLWRRWYRRRAS